MTEVIFSPILWQFRQEMPIIGSSPRNGGEAVFMQRTVWEWYGLRGNITNPRAEVSLSASDPCSSPRGPVGKESSQSFPPAMSCWLHSGMSKRAVTNQVFSHLVAVFSTLPNTSFYFYIFSPYQTQKEQKKTGALGSILSIPVAHKA